MQIIHPSMLPFVQVCLLFLLGFLGVLGVFLIYSGSKKVINGNQSWKNIILLILGLPLVVFAFYNYVGYKAIFSENERQIIGVFTDKSTSKRLDVRSDHQWEIKDDSGKNTITGSWEYIMSEDGNYWNFRSYNFTYRSQTGSSNRIGFSSKRLVFIK